MEYRVTWVIDLSAASPREAAEQALRIQRNPDSTADVFDVAELVVAGRTERIDLSDEEEDDGEE
jgi:hypothetical protein